MLHKQKLKLTIVSGSGSGMVMPLKNGFREKISKCRGNRSPNIQYSSRPIYNQGPNCQPCRLVYACTHTYIHTPIHTREYAHPHTLYICNRSPQKPGWETCWIKGSKTTIIQQMD